MPDQHCSTSSFCNAMCNEELLSLSLAKKNERVNEVERMPVGLSLLSQRNLLLASVSSDERLCSFAKLEDTCTYLIGEPKGMFAYTLYRMKENLYLNN